MWLNPQNINQKERYLLLPVFYDAFPWWSLSKRRLTNHLPSLPVEAMIAATETFSP